MKRVRRWFIWCGYTPFIAFMFSLAVVYPDWHRFVFALNGILGIVIMVQLLKCNREEAS